MAESTNTSQEQAQTKEPVKVSLCKKVVQSRAAKFGAAVGLIIGCLAGGYFAGKADLFNTGDGTL